MEDFTKSLKFIMTFLVFILLLSMFTNQKFTYSFLVLVLLSMVILNADKLKNMLGGLSYNE